MYHNVQRLSRLGYKAAKIGRELRMDRRTVKKYLNMSEQQYMDHIGREGIRNKLLDKYEEFVKARIEDCLDASAAQVHDWLKEHYDDLPQVSEKTVFNFVLHIRKKHGIPKPFDVRPYMQADELPYGQQGQVDFGVYNMESWEGQRKKVYFMSMVLSRSRQKCLWFSDRAMNTMDVIQAHEHCLKYFGGVPEQIVYDQDTLMLVSENYGDLILTQEFKQYVKHKGFKMYFCRKADPQTKGKVENVIKYIKYNFLRGRKYVDIHLLNSQGMAWLDRTANKKRHAATLKVPHDEWLIEKAFLKNMTESYSCLQTLKPYNVRKDNTVRYLSNFYQLPLKTYKGPRTKVLVRVDDGQIAFFDLQEKELIRYQLSKGRGELVKNNNLKRDYSVKIDEMILDLASKFPDKKLAGEFFQCVRKNNPRYVRDQLQLIKKTLQTHGVQIMCQVMNICKENDIYRATDIEGMAQQMALQNNQQQPITNGVEIKTLDRSAFKILPKRSNIDDYKQLLH
ncbi:MAG: IS21 family transposase [Bacteroidales bacterium]